MPRIISSVLSLDFATSDATVPPSEAPEDADADADADEAARTRTILFSFFLPAVLTIYIPLLNAHFFRARRCMFSTPALCLTAAVAIAAVTVRH